MLHQYSTLFTRLCCACMLHTTKIKQNYFVYPSLNFKEFEALATNEIGLSIGTLCTDNGGEYVSKEFEEFLKYKGIRYELTVPYPPAQNGVAERLNRTLMESARTMIRFARLPDSYWGEAVATTAYIRKSSHQRI